MAVEFDVIFEEQDLNEPIFAGSMYVVHEWENTPIATTDALGCVIVGDNLEVTGNGTLKGRPGTVTEIATGVGLTGGPITGSGTIKAQLKSESPASYSSVTPTDVFDRQYPVTPDADGNLSVNVPWTDTATEYDTMSQAEATAGTSIIGKLISAKVLVDTIIAKIASAIAGKQDIPLWVDMGTVSSLPVTKSVSGITADMMCTAYLLGTPSAQTGDWTVTTAAGSVTVSGTISGSTTLEIKLEKVNTVS